MPTGKIVTPGGVSSPSIQVPRLPGPPQGVRAATISNDGKGNANGVAGGRAIDPQPSVRIGYGTGLEAFYASFVPEIAKANFVNPSNQGRRAQGQFVDNYMPALGVNNPSRSQFAEGYTDALQQFAASNTWQLSGPTDSPGTRAKQPNQKFVSPFATAGPIPVKMPWDL